MRSRHWTLTPSVVSTVRMSSPVEAKRERVIHETWRHLGWALWNPRINGIDAPLKVAGCEYRLEPRKIGGFEQPCVVCEGIVVMSPDSDGP
jgi:hypothetical protein